jgi:hypothetical protein
MPNNAALFTKDHGTAPPCHAAAPRRVVPHITAPACRPALPLYTCPVSLHKMPENQRATDRSAANVDGAGNTKTHRVANYADRQTRSTIPQTCRKLLATSATALPHCRATSDNHATTVNTILSHHAVALHQSALLLHMPPRTSSGCHQAPRNRQATLPSAKRAGRARHQDARQRDANGWTRSQTAAPCYKRHKATYAPRGRATLPHLDAACHAATALHGPAAVPHCRTTHLSSTSPLSAQAGPPGRQAAKRVDNTRTIKTHRVATPRPRPVTTHTAAQRFERHGATTPPHAHCRTTMVSAIQLLHTTTLSSRQWVTALTHPTATP